VHVLAGYGRVEFTPAVPFPMAGLVTGKERVAERVRDPLAATACVVQQAGPSRVGEVLRCTAVGQGGVGITDGLRAQDDVAEHGGRGTWALVSIDLLIVDQVLYEAVEAALRPLGVDGFYLNATHTHSSLGGYVEGWGASKFMGKYRLEHFERIVTAVRDAVTAALADLKPVASIGHGEHMVPGITMNRRYRGGLTDDRVSAVVVEREGAAPVILASASGHPVIVSSMAPEAASADLPGEVCKALAADGYLPVFVSGPCGGLNLLFPEMPTSVDAHLALLTRSIVGGLRASTMVPSTPLGTGHRPSTIDHRPSTIDLPSAGFALDVLDFPRRMPPTVSRPLARVPKSLLTALAGHMFSRFAVPDPSCAKVRVTVMRLGDAVFVGMPADFGVGAALSLRERILREHGLFSIISSQTNGYAGYAHLPEEYLWRDDVQPGFFWYENAMAWYGPDVAARCNETAMRLISDEATSSQRGAALRPSRLRTPGDRPA